VRSGEAFIEMEKLELGGREDWPAMGRMLAALHRKTAERFGWASDNWIGLAPQTNGWSEDWIAFWRERRLAPQLERAGLASKAAPLLERLERFFPGYRPVPSLLHGDLWRGNAGFTPEGPVIFDPAVYYGDREADLAMTELFGGFPRAFYAAYEDAWPLDSGYTRRKRLYNLYHLLNHLNLFGASYLGQVHAVLRGLAAQLKN
jgi:fructosamine-3-kinase